MKITAKMRVKTRIVDAASEADVSESPWRENLILDQGLNGLAGSSAVPACKGNPAGCFSNCKVGSGTNPNSVASGAITFTQDNGAGSAGNILASSISFFTLAMVGQLFKWGTGSSGVETYIVSYTDPTHVVVDTSAHITVPAVGTVWNVTQTALQALLYTNDSFVTTSGACGTTLSGNQATHQRTFKFNQKVSPYTVNEIGYNAPSGGTPVVGRYVLGASDVIAPSQYYIVIMQLVITYGPAVPTPVTNVGTNINTAGAIMLEGIGSNAFHQVNSSGAVSAGNCGLEDVCAMCWSTGVYTQNSTPNTGNGLTWVSYLELDTPSWAYGGGALGVSTLTSNASISTSGQTLYGIGLGAAFCDVLFTTHQTAPTGTFQPNTVWSKTYTRVLTN